MNEPTPRTTPTPLIAGLIGGAVALIGVLRMPMPYYNTMRIVVAAACVTISVGAITRRKPLAIVPPAVLAIFFLFVKGLSKTDWAVIDVITAGVLIGLGIWLSREPIRD